MYQYSYNQPDSRVGFARLIEMLSPMLTSQQESFLRSISANTFNSDFNILMDVLKGKVPTPNITSQTINNAGEYYKQVNKALLIFRDLKDEEKLRESNEIDYEANRLINDWYNKLYQMRIHII